MVDRLEPTGPLNDIDPPTWFADVPTRTGCKALTPRTVAPNPLASNLCTAQLSGFSLHAGTVCRPHQRDSFRTPVPPYRPPAVSNEHLSVNGRGQAMRTAAQTTDSVA